MISFRQELLIAFIAFLIVFGSTALTFWCCILTGLGENFGTIIALIVFFVLVLYVHRNSFLIKWGEFLNKHNIFKD